MTALWIGLGIVVFIIIVLFIYSLCAIASKSDEIIEKMYQEMEKTEENIEIEIPQKISVE